MALCLDSQINPREKFTDWLNTSILASLHPFISSTYYPQKVFLSFWSLTCCTLKHHFCSEGSFLNEFHALWFLRGPSGDQYDCKRKALTSLGGFNKWGLGILRLTNELRIAQSVHYNSSAQVNCKSLAKEKGPRCCMNGAREKHRK